MVNIILCLNLSSMTMRTSINSHHYFIFSTSTSHLAIIALLHVLLSASSISCLSHPHPSISPRGLLFEDKSRLGSTPPTCHNKCNECHPCMAVQVPTLPNQDRIQPDLSSTPPLSSLDLSHQVHTSYSDYKPLGWKCHCEGHFFNP